ncbi:hypothetical protein V1514DRAFT_324169 [Lipomyces japonicus]|uniref:uncharacterized protein n=1 Tax=Lipomyces japonicus TaxID=56871 RepID=UPI0034CDFA94
MQRGLGLLLEFTVYIHIVLACNSITLSFSATLPGSTFFFHIYVIGSGLHTLLVLYNNRCREL